MAVENGQQRVIPNFLNRSVSPPRATNVQTSMHQHSDDDDDDVPLAVRKQILATSQAPSSKSNSMPSSKSNNHSEKNDVPKRNGETSSNAHQSSSKKSDKPEKTKDGKHQSSPAVNTSLQSNSKSAEDRVKSEPMSPTSKSGNSDRVNSSKRDESGHRDKPSSKHDTSASKRSEEKSSKKDGRSGDSKKSDKKDKRHHDDSSSRKKKHKHRHDDDDDDEDEEEDEEEEEEYKVEKKVRKSDATELKHAADKSKKSAHKRKTKSDDEDEEPAQRAPAKKRVKKEEEETVWRWWEEKREDDSVKWRTLEHRGPVFPAPYEPLPASVVFRYNGESMKLSPEAEETMTFYARMLDHEYTTKKVFNDNFFNDWRKTMTKEEREKIRHLSKCDMKEVAEYFKRQSEIRKQMTKEEKQKIKQETERIRQIYGSCMLDGHKEQIGNYKIEPPGLFRGRGDHPKMGMLKKRVQPEDVTINCSKGSKIPEPPAGHKWKEVRHDNTVTWLACWQENVQKNFKYVMLNAASKLKGEKDWNKYETARRLHQHIDRIRKEYRADWKHAEMARRQRGVALYFIDKLALRAGNEKDEDEADTVGCCSLRVEHVKLYDEHEGKQYVVQFDFLGKDSIRYFNEVPVEKKVYKNLKHFMANKKPEHDLFDRLNTATLNEYLKSLMPGLTAKVFRTYNASITLEQQLDLLTEPDQSDADKLLAYNRANRAVAILCNHQRSVPKTFQKSMENLETKISEKKAKVKEAKHEAKRAKAAYKTKKTDANRAEFEKRKKAYKRLEEQLHKLECSRTDKDENKTIALSTSKLNYLDPRISVAWCKKWNVPVEKVYNKTQRLKFRWAIEMATAGFSFAKL